MPEALAGAPEHLLHGRHTRLRPLLPADYDFIYRLSMQGESLWRWRYRGATPSPQLFQSSLWEGVLAQFVVEDRRQRSIGLVSLYNADMVSGHAYVGILIEPPRTGIGWPLEALLLLIEYGFTTWPFRKLYFEYTATNAGTFAESARRHLREEGRLIAHDFADGEYVDRIIASMTREHWAGLRHFLVREPLST